MGAFLYFKINYILRHILDNNVDIVFPVLRLLSSFANDFKMSRYFWFASVAIVSGKYKENKMSKKIKLFLEYYFLN